MLVEDRRHPGPRTQPRAPYPCFGHGRWDNMRPAPVPLPTSPVRPEGFAMIGPSRRNFLKLSAGIAAISGLSECPVRASRAGANETVVLAMMGVRGRAGNLM